MVDWTFDGTLLLLSCASVSIIELVVGGSDASAVLMKLGEKLGEKLGNDDELFSAPSGRFAVGVSLGS